MQPVTLSWHGTAWAVAHDVYFGEDRDTVANATTTTGIYRGRQSAEITSYDPPDILELAKTYYWRIDEVNKAHPNSPWKGRVWSFTTANFVVLVPFPIGKCHFC